MIHADLATAKPVSGALQITGQAKGVQYRIDNELITHDLTESHHGGIRNEAGVGGGGVNYQNRELVMDGNLITSRQAAAV